MSTLDTHLDRMDVDQPTPTGFKDLDGLTGGGLRPGELVVAAGFPGMGTSTFALDLARTASIRHSRGVYVAALESTVPHVTRRVLSAEARIALHHLAAGLLAEGDNERAAKAGNRIAGAPIRLSDRHRDLEAIRRNATASAEGADLRMLVVDGAHLLVPAHDYGGRAQFADDFARDLKEFAVDAGVTVVAALPLEFPFGTREGNLPLLRDFGKRQSFAAAADIVILLHRDDYYQWECPRAGEADLILAKSRNSPLATITVAFQGHYARFVDMAAS